MLGQFDLEADVCVMIVKPGKLNYEIYKTTGTQIG